MIDIAASTRQAVAQEVTTVAAVGGSMEYLNSELEVYLAPVEG